MSRMTDFTVPSTVPGRTLHAFCCEPEGEVRAVLQLSHGTFSFSPRSFLKSARVSNSDTSLANSSSTSGSSLALTS